MKIIIDASVVAKWYLRDESLAEPAERLRSDFINHRSDLLAPALIYYELGSLLTSAYQKFRIKREDLRLSLVNFYKLNLVIYQSEEILLEAESLTDKFRISFYDAAYVAVANLTKEVLYTADEKLIKAVSKKIPLVRHLSAYPT